MSTQSKSPGAFDGKFIIAMALTISIWVGWQAHLAKKYPEVYKAKTAAKTQTAAPQAVTEQAAKETAVEQTATDTAVKAPEASASNVVPLPAKETKLEFEDDSWRFVVSSKGMAVSQVALKKYSDRKGNPISFAQDESLSLFGTGLIGKKELLNFNLTKKSENEFVGETVLPDGTKITKVFQVQSQGYHIKTRVHVENIPADFMGLVTSFSEEIHKPAQQSFIGPTMEHQEFYAYHDGTTSRTAVTPDTAVAESFLKTHIAGFASQYFAAAVIDNSAVMPEFRASTLPGTKAVGTGLLTYNMLNRDKQFTLDYTAYAGPKSFELLKSVDADLTDMINLGFFRSFAKAILWLMKTIYAGIGNWGLAIIFLTIIVRIVVLPFNLISYKQMKAMSVIQPQMKTLREKYKNDQQRLNQEMMTLMKEAKANPLGGCLPMFIQIPVFFALYQVIGQSIELYQAPFIFWISDLSLKDPFYVLPLLMGITMYFQQKITPTTLEPAQQKIMNFLPIFFTFLMVTLPSGLTLYILVSSVFGVLQQLYFMKDNTKTQTDTAKA